MPHPDPVPSAEPDAGPLSIGELAARSGLSPKALRMYDESGLLPPRRVDPFTGYRSYGADQVARARLIPALRGVGMGLARIRVLCDLEPQAAAWELRSWWRQEQADALSRAAAVDDLALLLGEHPKEHPMPTTDTSSAPDLGAALDRGAVRPSQQDAVLTRTLPHGAALIAVADGFGSDDGLAARMLDALAASVESTLSGEEGPDCCPDLLGALQTAWCAVEDLVPDGSPAPGSTGQETADDGSGAALTAVLIQGDRLACAHIGDTRALLLRSERIDPITQDHTRVRSLLAAGRLSPEEAASHPERAVLNRALAAGAPTAPDLLLRTLEPGDTVVVLSDGIHAVLDPAILADALMREADDASRLAARLVGAALAAGGPDNAGAAVARTYLPSDHAPR